MLVNPSGLSGHAIRIDLNIEHLIRYLKVGDIHHMYPCITQQTYSRVYLQPKAYTQTGTTLAILLSNSSRNVLQDH